MVLLYLTGRFSFKDNTLRQIHSETWPKCDIWFSVHVAVWMKLFLNCCDLVGRDLPEGIIGRVDVQGKRGRGDLLLLTEICICGTMVQCMAMRCIFFFSVNESPKDRTIPDYY